MKKITFLLILFINISFSQTFEVVNKGYYYGKVGDTILPNRTTDLKSLTDVQEYLEKHNLELGTIMRPPLEVKRKKTISEPHTIIVRDTIYINNGDISIGNSWMGEPIGKTVVVRINAGGETFTDWVKMEAGNSYRYRSTSNLIKGETIKDMHDELFKELFKTEAYDTNSKRLSYAIPLPNGYYEVDFYMVSQYANTTLPGTRVFSILLEGKPKDTIDINERFGSLTAGKLTYGTEVIDGELNIEFENVVNNAVVNAIQIRK